MSRREESVMHTASGELLAVCVREDRSRDRKDWLRRRALSLSPRLNASSLI